MSTKNKLIFYSNNIKIYYPEEVKDINTLYQLFLEEKYDFYFDRYRKLNFTLEEFESLNLLLKINNEFDILQQCEFLGLPTHIDYKELIVRKIIDCGFLEGINFLYNIYKNKYDIVKIDLPETHIHPSVIFKLLQLISNNCKKLIIFTYSTHIRYYYPR